MIPNIKQWKSWSLVSKWTFIGGVVGVLGLLINVASSLNSTLEPNVDLVEERPKITYPDAYSKEAINVLIFCAHPLLRENFVTLEKISSSQKLHPEFVKKIMSVFAKEGFVGTQYYTGDPEPKGWLLLPLGYEYLNKYNLLKVYSE